MRTYTASKLTRSGLLALAACFAINGCSDESTNNPGNPVVLMNHSATPAFVKNVASGIEVFSLIGSDDTLAGSPAFIFGGSADGAGLLRNSDGSFSMIVNHEDNFSVSRVTLDKTLEPVRGEYLMNSDDGQWRLCSATLATPEEHGFGPLFLTCGESGVDSRTHAVNPSAAPGQGDRIVDAFGAWSAENAMPLAKDAYSGKTVVVITDDDSGPAGGQVALYVSSTVGDLDNGNLYVMARTDDNVRETDMQVGQTYNVEFRQIPNQKSVAATEFNTKAGELKAIQFGRVEDIDYRKGSSAGTRELYFTVTGQNNTGVNADNSRTKYGRIYRLTLSANDPTKGTLEVVLNGDDRSGPAKTFQNPDNVCVTNNFVYIQEDPNGYGDETHDSYIYQYDIASKSVKVMMELDHHRGDAKYNVGGDSKFGAWEYGALVDISTQTGIPGTFMLCVQPHTWTGDRYRNPDGGTKRPNENQASQILILKGLPR